VQGYRPEGDRVQLANYWFAEAAEGQWTVVEGEWNEGFFRQVDSFPLPGVHDDRVTSVSGARATLKPFSGTKDIDFLHL
jgi:phage terminase large subunit-like protein